MTTLLLLHGKEDNAEVQASQLVDIRNGDVIQFMCVTRDEVRPEVAEVVLGAF